MSDPRFTLVRMLDERLAAQSERSDPRFVTSRDCSGTIDTVLFAEIEALTWALRQLNQEPAAGSRDSCICVQLRYAATMDPERSEPYRWTFDGETDCGTVIRHDSRCPAGGVKPASGPNTLTFKCRCDEIYAFTVEHGRLVALSLSEPARVAWLLDRHWTEADFAPAKDTVTTAQTQVDDDSCGCIETADFAQSFDARVWATAFVALVAAKPTIATDEGTMLGWFANALMRGWDEHARRYPEPISPIPAPMPEPASAERPHKWVQDFIAGIVRPFEEKARAAERERIRLDMLADAAKLEIDDTTAEYGIWGEALTLQTYARKLEPLSASCDETQTIPVDLDMESFGAKFAEVVDRGAYKHLTRDAATLVEVAWSMNDDPTDFLATRAGTGVIDGVSYGRIGILLLGVDHLRAIYKGLKPAIEGPDGSDKELARTIMVEIERLWEAPSHDTPADRGNNASDAHEAATRSRTHGKIDGVDR